MLCVFGSARRFLDSIHPRLRWGAGWSTTATDTRRLRRPISGFAWTSPRTSFRPRAWPANTIPSPSAVTPAVSTPAASSAATTRLLVRGDFVRRPGCFQPIMPGCLTASCAASSCAPRCSTAQLPACRSSCTAPVSLSAIAGISVSALPDGAKARWRAWRATAIHSTMTCPWSGSVLRAASWKGFRSTRAPSVESADGCG